MSRVYLNCLGINNSAGASIDQVYQSIFVQAEIRSEQVDLISGRKTSTRPVAAVLPEIPEDLTQFASRNNQLLLQAVEQIRPQIDLAIEKYGKQKIAIVLGTSTSGIRESEKAFISRKDGQFPDDFIYYRQEIASPSSFLRSYLGLESYSYTISTACTSSAKALIEAKRLLDANLCEAVIVGGVDALSSLTLDGFDSLDSVSAKITNPLSHNRDGINIGEGAALFLMSREVSEIEFAGYGESSDAYHISSPEPTGIAPEMAMKAALEMAKISSEQIAYVNLHATGTRKNDEMETAVTHRVFGNSVPVSGTKPFIGHTLGAAGAQEAALCYMALSQNINKNKLLPAHLWDGEIDTQLPVLKLVQKGEQIQGQYCMSNSYAFGGNNVSLILAGSAR